jgi:hypothetical protein
LAANAAKPDSARNRRRFKLTMIPSVMRYPYFA